MFCPNCGKETDKILELRGAQVCGLCGVVIKYDDHIANNYLKSEHKKAINRKNLIILLSIVAIIPLNAIVMRITRMIGLAGTGVRLLSLLISMVIIFIILIAYLIWNKRK
ncbi:MAG: TFIIB-type zinc ribbon-containing protein [Ruminococcus sp.]|nr:TFIIB-type zinc ribbon-containing protein [Ruminococcus sp.]